MTSIHSTLKPSLIDIDSIIAPTKREEISLDEATLVANTIESILTFGRSMVNLLVTRSFQNGGEVYQIVGGEAIYWAAVAAKEKNADIYMINAYILEDDQIEMAKHLLENLLT